MQYWENIVGWFSSIYENETRKFVDENWKLPNKRGIKSYVPIRSGKLLLQYWENFVPFNLLSQYI